MRLLNLAATSSLAALVLTLGVDQLKADHDGWSGNQRGWGPRAAHQNNQQGNWWQRQPAQPQQRQAWPQPGTNNFFNWGQPQPQAELPRSQNIEPEAPPAKAPVIYTYRADPLVDLADANLTRGRVAGDALGPGQGAVASRVRGPEDRQLRRPGDRAAA
jgi:hypothetical protein